MTEEHYLVIWPLSWAVFDGGTVTLRGLSPLMGVSIKKDMLIPGCHPMENEMTTGGSN